MSVWNAYAMNIITRHFESFLDVRCKHVAVNGIKEKPEDGGSIPGRGQ
jgi:hypothetical protein